MRSLTPSLAALVAAAIAYSAMDAPHARAAEARIGGFAFVCKTLGGAVLKPKSGDVPGVTFTDLPAEREACRRSVDDRISACSTNIGFASGAEDRRHAGCLSIFERQVEACATFFREERAKCDAGGAETPDSRAGAESREADGGERAREPAPADDGPDPWAEAAAREPFAPDPDVDETADEAETGARLFAAQALALRAAGVEGSAPAAAVLAAMPGAGLVGAGAALPALWRPFFANAVVKLGRLRSPAPAALYYDPLLDLAILTFWERSRDGWRVAAARALPGERLADRKAAAPLRPAWTTAADGPAAALRRIAAARLAAFRRAHPAGSRRPARDTASFAAAAADMRAGLPRLVWRAAAGASWAGQGSVWLPPLLGRIDAALAARDAGAVRAAAPDTGPAQAAALARLPPAFAASLALDAAMPAGTEGRLLVASSPDDGAVYLLALCRLQGEACALRRLTLAALAESE